MVSDVVRRSLLMIVLLSTGTLPSSKIIRRLAAVAALLVSSSSQFLHCLRLHFSELTEFPQNSAAANFRGVPSHS